MESTLLHDLFREQAEKVPNQVAVYGAKGQTITYGELNRCTDVLACKLQTHGVRPDCVVVIYMERCIQYTVAYIAILKAGGAYLPLDISFPQNLINNILVEATPKIILTTSELKDRFPAGSCVICLDEDFLEHFQNGDDKVESFPMTWDNLSYLAYSSGTTGKPKGIMCPHKGAVLSYKWRHENYPYGDDEREACNIFFVWEMLRPLLKGVPMFIIPDSVIYDPQQLCQFIKEHKITRMLFTPSLLEVTLNTVEIMQLQECFQTMRSIWFCGEVVTTILLERCIQSLPHAKFVNLYSISECHDVACLDLTEYYEKKKSDLHGRKFCPVGRHLPQVQILIMNEEREVQPVGVSGEICIGGPTLAHGYLKMPELNAQRFIQRPSKLSAEYGDRFYRTGDWGYMLSDGNLEICGRCDSMVKIRGYSIEVQAVEVCLMSLPEVNNCTVVVNGEEGENKFLVAYIVPNGGDVSRKDIRSQLRKKLPFYMIPSYFIILKSIPVVPASGKLDKKALPKYDSQVDLPFSNEGLPSTDTEKKLAQLWKNILQLRNIDIEESFFDLGGHSLLAAALLNQVMDEFRVEMSVKDMFLFPNVKQQAQLIDGRLHHSSSIEKDMKMEPQTNLLEEVELHDTGFVNIDMSLRAFWRSFRVGNRWNKGRVLITGGSGFLGAFLIRELLLNTKTFIYSLIREHPDVSAHCRLINSLKKFGILAKDEKKATEKQKIVARLLPHRLATVKGDVAIVNLGMNEEEYMHMCTEVDFIIHAAASVNLAYPYIALQGPNVLGTQNVVLFAFTGKVKPLHHISTDSVFPHGLSNCGEDDDITTYHNQLSDGYSQSKWVAELLVERARKRGLPAVVYRLGNLSGDRENVNWNPQDFTLLMLQACATYGVAPEENWDMEMTPVDFTANLIVRITQNLAQAVGKTLHIISTKPAKSNWVFEWMNGHGFPVRKIPFDDWKSRIKSESEKADNPKQLWGLVENYIKDIHFFSKLSTYTNSHLQEILKNFDLTYPETDSALLRVYFGKLSRQGIFPTPSRMSVANTSLHGKVVVITGASSGIGAAIGEALVKAGANVALAARRLDKLQELCTRLKEDGPGLVIAVKTDVTDKEQVKELVRHTECSLGPIDVLINNAGVMYYTLMKNLKEAEWERMIDINCKGSVNCIGAVLDGMIKKGSGHIVNITSDAGRRGFPGLAVYSGSKFFLEGLSQALREEVASNGIRVTCLQPGDVKTELIGHTTDEEAKEMYDASSKVKVLEPEDVARACVYALSQPAYVAVNEILIEPRESPI